MKTGRFVAIILLAVGLFGWGCPAFTQPRVDIGGIGFDVRLGFDGRFRPGSWVPVHIQLVNESVPFTAQVEVITVAGSILTINPSYTVYRRPVTLPSGTRKQLLMTVPISSTYYPIDVRLVEANGNILRSTRIPVRDAGITSDIILVLDPSGERWTWLQEVAQQPPGYTRRARAYVTHIKFPHELPAAWVAYESVRTVILTDTFPVANMSREQLQALLRWVEAGGHLLVVGGATQNVAAVPELQAALPVNLTGGTHIQALHSLDKALPPFPAELRTVVWNASAGSGHVDIEHNGTPLIAHQWRGAGRITYVGFDLAAQPLRNWQGLDAFSRTLVFPQRLVRRVTGQLERNLLPLLSSQRVAYPPHSWLAPAALLYLAALAGSLWLAGRRPWGWLLVAASIAFASLYVHVVVRAAANRSLRAYGEVRISQVPPRSGYAHSIAVAQMVNMQGGYWLIDHEDNTHMAPTSSFALGRSAGPGTVFVVEQNDDGLRLGPTAARQALAMTSQSLLDLPLRVSAERGSSTITLTITNQTPWRLHNAFYIERERYVWIGEAAAGATAEFKLPADRFIIATDALSPEWIAASVATVAAQNSPDTDKRELEALKHIVVHALTPDRQSLELPWGAPIVVAMLDTPVTPPLQESFTGLGYHFVVIPLSSLL